MRIEEVVKREVELLELYGRAKDANDSFGDACKHVAALAETTPKVIRQYIAAMASEKPNTVRNEAEQLVMLFNSTATLQQQAA